jgi:heme-degrading monooxygenase HmoA
MPNKKPVSAPTPLFRRKLFRSFGFGVVAALAGQNLRSQLYAQGPGKSVQLHIYIEVKPGKGPDLEKLYHSSYVPAIKVQDGFLSTRLLRQYDSTSKYEIDISFKTEKQRAAWAQSKEHQSAWPKVEELGAKITWQGFDLLA